MPSFRGASADAVAALEDAVTGSASSAGPGLADGLLLAASTLRREGSLRRFLTDASVPAEGRTGLAGQVFGSSVGEDAARVVSDAVSRRWTRAGDLPVALEHLGVVAQVGAAGDDAGRLSDELFALAQAIKDEPALRDALSDPARSVADKSSLVDDLIGATALPATVALAKQALDGAHRTVTVALEEYQKVAAAAHGQGVATVRVAHELSDADRDRLAAALQRQYGRPVHLNVLVDPDVLGGIRVEIGDDVIDGTVAHRLADARRLLAG